MGYPGTLPLFSTTQEHCLSVLNSPDKKTLTVLHDSLEHKPWCAISEVREQCQSLLRQGAPDSLTLIFCTQSSLEEIKRQEIQNRYFPY